MRKFLLCIAVVFAFGMMAAAQDTGAQSGGAMDHGKMKGHKMAGDSGAARTTTGCIEKSGDGYMLKNGRYKEGVKVTGSDDLGPHAGHSVKLTGSWTTPGKEFAETKLDMVAASCKSAAGSSMSSGGEASGGKKKGAAAGSTPPKS